jgi:hypothetical protein
MGFRRGGRPAHMAFYIPIALRAQPPPRQNLFSILLLKPKIFEACFFPSSFFLHFILIRSRFNSPPQTCGA